MNIIKYDGIERVEDAMKKDDPLMAVISFDGENAVVSHLDEAVEHHILLNKAGLSSVNIDKYYRIIFDRSGADWTFVCPPDYKGITEKQKRIAAFYKDGFQAISGLLSELGYFIDINIPKRYKRHFEALGE